MRRTRQQRGSEQRIIQRGCRYRADRPSLHRPRPSSWRGEVLRVGSSGAAVAEVQRALAALGFDPGPADGAFGRKTRRAVLAFQRSSGLKATGRVNRQTIAMLNRALAGLGG